MLIKWIINGIQPFMIKFGHFQVQSIGNGQFRQLDDELRCRLNDNSDSDNEIRFLIKSDSNLIKKSKSI